MKFELDHINLNVVSIEKALKYYVDVLGFKIIGDFNLGRRFLYISNGEVTYELFENSNLNETVIDHIAYKSNDIKKDFEYFKSKNVEFITDLNFIPLWENGVYFFLFKGVNNEVIEFCQKK